MAPTDEFEFFRYSPRYTHFDFRGFPQDLEIQPFFDPGLRTPKKQKLLNFERQYILAITRDRQKSEHILKITIATCLNRMCAGGFFENRRGNNLPQK